jgi:hypothetical protein
VCAAAVFTAGCHHNNLNSGYGIAWVTLSDTPGDFTSYVVNVDSLTLTGTANGAITAISAVETVDFAKLNSIDELWSAASIPNDTYTSATIVLDYTAANISVMVNGSPVQATVVDTTGAAVTTQTINITFDPNNKLVIQPTLYSSSAVRVAVDFNLPASNTVNLTTSPPTVTVKPIMTVATSASDTKPIVVRGPLINSDVTIDTYTVYVRPFYDEVNALGTLSLFNGPDTVFLINGVTYVGAAGLTALSQLSAGTTITEAYTTFTPTSTLNAAVTAGKFFPTYVVAGSTLEDYYTQGLEGDVIARYGNTVTLRGSTLQLNDGSSQYNDANAEVLLGTATIVTAEDNTTLKGLNYNSVAVGQHIIARGIYSLPASGIVTVDATGSSSTNTGSVRLQNTQIWGPLVSSASNSLVLDLQTIENWPFNTYNYAGDGVTPVDPANYVVNTGGIALPAVAPGDPLWIEGIVAGYGAAPPNFLATSINAEATVPASLQVTWTSAGTLEPFATLTNAGLTIDLSNEDYSSGVIRIGPESIDLKSLPASPTIVPIVPPPASAGLPPVFLPAFAIGNLTSTADTTSVAVFNTYAAFVTQLPLSIVTATPAYQFVATGLFDRATNTFTASSMDVVN